MGRGKINKTKPNHMTKQNGELQFILIAFLYYSYILNSHPELKKKKKVTILQQNSENIF